MNNILSDFTLKFREPEKQLTPSMALRTLETDEIDYLYKQIQKINVLHGKISGGKIQAYNYDWRQLSNKLCEAIDLYNAIIESEGERKVYETNIHRQYTAYLSNGGTMSLEEWEKDGRFDKSLIE